jgi:putative ABC transport system substrate-binding protein
VQKWEKGVVLDMKRREFITLLGGAAAWPLTARAQQAAMPVIGFLFAGLPAPSILSAFSNGLSEMGFVVGRNAAIDHRWTEDQNDRLPAFAAELVGRKVAIIYAAGGDHRGGGCQSRDHDDSNRLPRRR